jgi:hypothetical protein
MNQFLELRQEFQDRQILDVIPISKRKEFHCAYALGVTFP